MVGGISFWGFGTRNRELSRMKIRGRRKWQNGGNERELFYTG